MYLALDPHTQTHVFTESDPREEGFPGRVDEVSLTEEFPEIQEWPDGKHPQRLLGVSERDSSEYRVFPSQQGCRSAGFRPLSTEYWTGRSWQDWKSASK